MEIGTTGGLEILSLRAVAEVHRAPLLFVHGGFHAAWCWAEHFMPFFSKHGWHTHALSLRDHGGSARSADPARVRLLDYVDDLSTVARHIGVPCVLVGHSLGGSVVQKYLETQQAPAAVLMAPSPIGGSTRAAMKMLARHPRHMLQAFWRRDLRLAMPAFLEFFFSSGVLAERYAPRLTGQTSMAAALDAFFRNPPNPGKVRTPALVLGAEGDWSIPHAANTSLAAAYGTALCTVKGAHDVMLDHAWRDAAEAIDRWLTQQLPRG